MGDGGYPVAGTWRNFSRERKLLSRNTHDRIVDFDGARRENVLREAAYAWVPDSWSFFKLLEVGFLPTWILFLF